MILLPLLHLFAIFTGTFAALEFHHYTTENYPNPVKWSEHQRCGLIANGHICDPDSLLGRSERDKLAEIVGKFPEWTKSNFSPPTSPYSDCGQKGIVLGIALSHFPIKKADNKEGRHVRQASYHPYGSHGHDEDYNVDEDEAGEEHQVTTTTTNTPVVPMPTMYTEEMEVAGILAEKWMPTKSVPKYSWLTQGRAEDYCPVRQLMLLLHKEGASSTESKLHIFVHKSIPIFQSDVHHLRNNIMDGENIYGNTHFDKLERLISALRNAIVHRQKVFSGQFKDGEMKVGNIGEKEKEPELEEAMLALLFLVVIAFLAIRHVRTSRLRAGTGAVPGNGRVTMSEVLIREPLNEPI